MAAPEPAQRKNDVSGVSTGGRYVVLVKKIKFFSVNVMGNRFSLESPFARRWLYGFIYL